MSYSRSAITSRLNCGAATTHSAHRYFFRGTLRIFGYGFSIIIGPIPVLAPLPYVAVHIVKSKAIWLFLANGMNVLIAILRKWLWFRRGMHIPIQLLLEVEQSA